MAFKGNGSTLVSSTKNPVGNHRWGFLLLGSGTTWDQFGTTWDQPTAQLLRHSAGSVRSIVGWM